MRATKLIPLAEVVTARDAAAIAAVYAETDRVLGAWPYLGAVVYDPETAGATFRLSGAPPAAEDVLLWVLRCSCCRGLFTPADRDRRPSSRLYYCSDRCRVRHQRDQYNLPNTPPPTCAGCGAPLGPDARLSRRHCSPACKQRAYRTRRAADRPDGR